MKQGEVWMTHFHPVQGSEQAGRRPAVIVSGNALNDAATICIVCPLTTVIKLYPGSVVVRGNMKSGHKKDSEVLSSQIRVISKSRLKKRLGIVSGDDIREIISGINDVLTL